MGESGFLLVNKPAGVTSHDVVAVVRRLRATQNKERRTRNLANQREVKSPLSTVPKVGHAGTLDPLATGLLVIGVGGATKKLSRVLRMPKTYEAEITLGVTSDTDDAEGVVREMPKDKIQMPNRRAIERALQAFVGTIEQVPPAYSAVKVRGVPAHRRVRRGESVQLQPRRVTIHELHLADYAFPTLRLTCTVSSGTYIRALARDIGAALGTDGVLSSLTRTAIGPLRLADAVPLAEVGTAPLLDRLETTAH